MLTAAVYTLHVLASAAALLTCNSHKTWFTTGKCSRNFIVTHCYETN